MLLNKRTEIEWTPYLACAYAEGFCEGEVASLEEQIEAWAYIYDNNLHHSLQAFYSRKLEVFVDDDILSKSDEGVTINWEEVEQLNADQMSKKITYHKSHKWVDYRDVEHTFVTQLYQIGVYCILDGNPALQGNFTPSQIVRIEAKLQKKLDNKKIKSFELGIPITVHIKNGLWEEVK